MATPGGGTQAECCVNFSSLPRAETSDDSVTTKVVVVAKGARSGDDNNNNNNDQAADGQRAAGAHGGHVNVASVADAQMEDAVIAEKSLLPPKVEKESSKDPGDRIQCTMGQNQVILRHEKFSFP